jgi:hypothetical protein
MDDEVPRRTYLATLLATGLTSGVAGCNTSSDGSDSTSTTESTTAAPNQAPRILAHDATPQNNGTTLAVSLEGEDDQELSLARIEYAGKIVEEAPESASVSLDGNFTELGATDLNETPGQITYVLRDIDGRETRAEVRPDETAPRLLDFSAQPTENAGEIALLLEGRDDVGLEEVQLLLGGSPQLQENVSGQKEYSTDQNVGTSEDAKFRQNTVTASLQDWNGNTTETEAETYVRKYDVMEDTRMDIGAIYLPWMGDKFGEILSGDEVEPAIGHYDDLVEQQNEVVNQHIDQMQGHGITEVMFTFGTSEEDYRAFGHYEKAALSSEFGVEAFFALPDPFKYNRDIGKDFDFLRENVVGKSNYNTVDNRPVVQFWGPRHLVYNIRDEIEDRYGGLKEFVDYTRQKLTRDGVEPFLVADASGRGYYNHFEAEEFWAAWDGLTNWPASTEANKTIPQEEAIEWVKKDYKGIKKFTEKNNQDFYPIVIPGFNDTHNEGWGQDRRIPRSTSAFRDRLQLAERYADGRINIYSFNEWAEGSQIEPGRFLDSDYGTDYLEVVEEFQTSN